ncbi:MAG: UDP-N-acetylmuramoyl-tripeptide--D-alanyl-D-alanine ligase [Acidobacteria bacterium]|nr:UDP-N-acetylmuramoyl-tripeptide--D-alanyl-D-alanine ligase [Acidobacteriota bacterium]
MIARTAAELAAAVGGAVASGRADATARGVSIDSRSIAAGDAFFAILGERHDGHDFATAAAAAGASLIVASRPVEAPGTTVVRVDDTTAALGRLAADERSRRRRAVVAITGSAGKTTTRALTVAALGARFRVAGSTGNLNNQWGLPLSLLRLPDEADAAVLEIGINHPGELAPLARIARPDVGVVTNVGTAHIGFFADQRELAEEKAQVVFETAPSGTGVIHLSSPFLHEIAQRSGRRLVTFDRGGNPDLRADDLSGDLVGGSRFTVDGVPVRLALWGEHAVLNALAALGAARALGVPLAEAAPRLAAVAPQPGRGRVRRLAHGVVLVDDTYNSNPSAAKALLAALAASPWDGRRVALLGDMYELGERSPAFHREVGEAAARAGIDLLVTVGAFAHDAAEGARAAGLRDALVLDDVPAAAAALAGLLQPGDLVLAKASRGVGLERALPALLEQFPELAPGESR